MGRKERKERRGMRSFQTSMCLDSTTAERQEGGGEGGRGKGEGGRGRGSCGETRKEARMARRVMLIGKLGL